MNGLHYTNGMVMCMDSAIGEIIAALKGKRMWDNTVFVFESDNGGEAGGSSNYLIYSGLLKELIKMAEGYIKMQLDVEVSPPAFHDKDCP